MKKFTTFYFEKYSFQENTLEAKFYYSFDKKEVFEEIINFKSDYFDTRKNIDLEVIDNLLFHLHIALGISYYKLYPTEKLVVKSGFLDDKQISFWKKFYINGLGEFLYTNKIKAQGLFNFINEKDSKKHKKIDFEVDNKLLLALGGGKDSIVSYSLIKDLKFDTYVFGKLDKIKENTSKLMGKTPLLITRKISENLFELNKKGYYNGHVPITGIIAFLSEIVCYLYNYKYIILSNEKSASQENTIWEGIKINHQYSKSLDFEIDFENYVETYISDKVKYFSLLRGMYEYKIAEIFSKQKKFFNDFSSCNRNFKLNASNSALNTSNWCNSCPKCAFVFTILSGFLDEKELIQIFGENLYEKKELENLFRELLGISGIKPFECVGEAEEVTLSMYKYYLRKKESGLPFILQIFEKEVLVNLDLEYLNNLEKKLLKIYDKDIIPPEIKERLRELNKNYEK